jgi:hypothetical protein
MNLKRKIGISLILMTVSLNIISQEKSNNFALTIDLLGNSGFYSVNGEYLIGKINNYQVNARAGFGYCEIRKGLGFIGVPFGLNLLTGKKNHHLELGLGASYLKGMSATPVLSETYIESEGIYFIPSIGYRFDKLTNGFVFKVYYSPLISVFDFFNKEKFFNEINQMMNRNVTEEEILNLTHMGITGYPTIKSSLVYFGVSIGYRF